MTNKQHSYKKFDLLAFIATAIFVTMLVMPIPAKIFNALLIAFIAVSFAFLLLAFFSPKKKPFSFFPTLLILVTLFFLALKIASSRQILLSASNNAQLIQNFANVLERNSNLNGIIILFIFFLIALAIFIRIITRGTERLTEAGARFAVDGMPLKQASIEQEYNSGKISEKEKDEQTQALQQKSNVLNAMSQATKFFSIAVKIGFLITFINLIGGTVFAIVLHDESVSDAIHTSASLTISDGFLFLLPVLFIAIAIGLLSVGDMEETQM